jgi:hypothetical protein
VRKSALGSARRFGALLLLSALSLAAGGCGAGAPPGPAGLRLEREDLVVVCHALQRVQGEVATEVARTKAAWPLVADGLPSNATAAARPQILAATEAGATLEVPAIFEEARASVLTGPGAEVAGLFRSYIGLATHGWQLIGAAIDQIEHGPAVARKFARANVNLYIESVYDAHFSLAQTGKKLLDGYRKLGGASAFGASLTQAEVNGLAATYSEPSDRLHPHVGVRLGS